jgi:OPA family glycerol-3-phosphate transporter-like MFS transporter/OPA family sugar phosphate sensor protein UhpC-like MFS transporter
MLEDPVEIARQSRYWRRRILIGTMVGYAAFYLVRKNLSTAMPMMEEQLGISKRDLGLFLTLHGVLYGFSKFFNGFLGDRANARFFMAAGLLLSALTNIIFGSTSLAIVMGIVWMFNGWFQGMGFPPCARLLSHWFTPKELVTKFSIWNASHSIGAAAIMILGGYLAMTNWRLCFFVPAGIAVVCVVYILMTLRDTPESLGLPHIDQSRQARIFNADGEEAPFWPFLVEYVFSNKYIWLLSLANFFVYTIRYAFLDWGMTLLKQSKHIELSHGGYIMAAFEMTGAVGAMLGGWISDRYAGGRAARVCLVYMLLCAASIWAFWKLAGNSVFGNTFLLCTTGFLIYGPQCLLAAAAANLATKRAAATAVGLTGIFGYGSTVLSGWGLGALVQHEGWDRGFQALIAVALIGAVFCAASWTAKSDGYGEAAAPEQA